MFVFVAAALAAGAEAPEVAAGVAQAPDVADVVAQAQAHLLAEERLAAALQRLEKRVGLVEAEARTPAPSPLPELVEVSSEGRVASRDDHSHGDPPLPKLPALPPPRPPSLAHVAQRLREAATATQETEEIHWGRTSKALQLGPLGPLGPPELEPPSVFRVAELLLATTLKS